MAISCRANLSLRKPISGRAVSCSRKPVQCRAQARDASGTWQQVLTASCVAATAVCGNLLAAQVAFAEFRLPPIDKDPNRCERGYVGNTIGQANAVSDKVLDLRECVYKGKSLSGKTLAGALLVKTDMSDTNLQEAVLTKAYAENANFEGADMTNAVVDRVVFTKANLKNVKFINAVITGATFEGADLDGADFTDALIGSEDVKRLCENPTLKGDSRYQVGCRR